MFFCEAPVYTFKRLLILFFLQIPNLTKENISQPVTTCLFFCKESKFVNQFRFDSQIKRQYMLFKITKGQKSIHLFSTKQLKKLIHTLPQENGYSEHAVEKEKPWGFFK